MSAEHPSTEKQPVPTTRKTQKFEAAAGGNGRREGRGTVTDRPARWQRDRERQGLSRRCMTPWSRHSATPRWMRLAAALCSAGEAEVAAVGARERIARAAICSPARSSIRWPAVVQHLGLTTALRHQHRAESGLGLDLTRISTPTWARCPRRTMMLYRTVQAEFCVQRSLLQPHQLLRRTDAGVELKIERARRRSGALGAPTSSTAACSGNGRCIWARMPAWNGAGTVSAAALLPLRLRRFTLV